MSSPTISEIREGIAEALAAIQDDSGSPQADAYANDNPPVPSIRVLRPEEVRYDEPSMHCDSYTFVVQAMVGLLDDISAQKTLDEMIARGTEKSVKSAIEATDADGNASLNGRVDQAWVVNCTGYREYEIGGATYLGAEWEVQIETSPS